MADSNKAFLDRMEVVKPDVPQEMLKQFPHGAEIREFVALGNYGEGHNAPPPATGHLSSPLEDLCRSLKAERGHSKYMQKAIQEDRQLWGCDKNKK
jgi:hypothetical protein